MCSRGSSACGSFAIHLVKVVSELGTKAQALSASCCGSRNVDLPSLCLVSFDVTTVLLLTVVAGYLSRAGARPSFPQPQPRLLEPF